MTVILDFGIKKNTDIISDHLDKLWWGHINIFLTAKVMN